MDCSPPGFSVHEILQARMLEWIAISSPVGSSWPRIEPVSPALASRFFTTEPPGKPYIKWGDDNNTFHRTVWWLNKSMHEKFSVWGQVSGQHSINVRSWDLFSRPYDSDVPPRGLQCCFPFISASGHSMEYSFRTWPAESISPFSFANGNQGQRRITFLAGTGHPPFAEAGTRVPPWGSGISFCLSWPFLSCLLWPQSSSSLTQSTCWLVRPCICTHTCFGVWLQGTGVHRKGPPPIPGPQQNDSGWSFGAWRLLRWC